MSHLYLTDLSYSYPKSTTIIDSLLAGYSSTAGRLLDVIGRAVGTRRSSAYQFDQVRGTLSGIDTDFVKREAATLTAYFEELASALLRRRNSTALRRPDRVFYLPQCRTTIEEAHPRYQSTTIPTPARLPDVRCMLNGSMRYALNRINAAYPGVSGLLAYPSGMICTSRKKVRRRKRPIMDTRIKTQLPVFQLRR